MKMTNLKWKAEAYFPVGVQWETRLSWIIFGYVASILYSFSYFHYLSESYWSLFDSKKLLPEAVMDDYKVIVDNCFVAFAILILCMLYLMVANYRYHYQGSKSIYLMRRLPKKHELCKRCFILPAAVILLTLATILLLLVVYYEIYLFVTPKQCLTPGQWQKLWNF